MSKVKISLILPIYNVEKYLDRCLKSIIKQDDFNELEVLLIDDGSTDSSSIICDKYSKEYSNIFTYHKENGGLSNARNYGLLKSHGDYVFFIDSDDMLNDNVIKELYSIVKKDEYDIVAFDALCIDENDKCLSTKYKYKHYNLDNYTRYTGEKFVKKQLIYDGDFKTPVWLCMYNRIFLISNALLFENGLIHEDEMWSPKVLLLASSIFYIKKDIYLYRIRNNSIMRDSEKNYFKHLSAQIYIFESLFVYFEKNIKDKKLFSLINNCFVTRYLHSLSLNHINQNKTLLRRISKRKILKKSKCTKNIIRSILLILNSGLYVRITKRKQG